MAVNQQNIADVVNQSGMQISIEDKKIIEQAYAELNEALVAMNGAHGHNYGKSMYMASQQVKGFIDSKKSNNGVAAQYLRKFHEDKSKEQAEKSMKDKGRESVHGLDDTGRVENIRKIQKAVDTLKQVMEKYKGNMMEIEKSAPNIPQRSQQALRHGPKLPSAMGNPNTNPKDLPVQNPAGAGAEQITQQKMKHGTEKLKIMIMAIEQRKEQVQQIFQNQQRAA
ncbi:MAG: hypothetical protein MJ187_01640 [Alphaproteobacteria bacterium]|nr:hypothetical protein [Alphaproteobacteria bacterium]